MPLINRIQKEILALNGGEFQKLADDYLFKEGYSEFVSLGSVTGSNKTRKGTPDTYQLSNRGKYIFVEHTTVDNINKRLINKLLEDLGKCFDENKTGIKLKDIEEVVLCHTGKLETSERDQLESICKKNKVNLNVYGIERIAHDLKERYKFLAKDHLGIEVDTGQIVEKEEFIREYESNALVTPLTTKLIHRTEILSKIIESLDSVDLVFISGGQGTGKTRVGIEAVENFLEKNSDYTAFYVFNKFNQDLFNDLRVIMSEVDNLLLLVDDANRISRFDYFTTYVLNKREKQNLKIIATVRDYAVSTVLDQSRKILTSEFIKIEKLTNDQIKELIVNEYNILNPDFQQRIMEIADGNPRLAMMAGKIADETQDILELRDVTELYDKYYKSIEEDFKKFEDSNYLKVAGLIAFFRAIDFKHEELMSSLSGTFDLKQKQIEQISLDLHLLEIVDIYEEEIVKVSDQILATYILYLALFKKKDLSLKLLLENYFPSYKRKFIDALNPIYSFFDGKELLEIMTPDIKDIISQLREEKEEEVLIEYLNSFWFVDISGTLAYIKKTIEDISLEEEVEIEYSDLSPESGVDRASTISILSKFNHAELHDFKIGVELLCLLIQKKPSKVKEVLNVFTDSFSFKYDSWKYGYEYQNTLLDVIWELSEQGIEIFSKIFLRVSECFLKTHYSEQKHSRGNSISIINFELPPTDKLLELRSKIWDRLFSLYETDGFKEEVFGIINNYENNGMYESAFEILQLDSKNLLSFAKDNLDANDFKHCYFIKNYLNFLSNREVKFDEQVKVNFSNKKTQLLEILIYDEDEYSEDQGYEERRRKREEGLKGLIKDFKLSDYFDFIDEAEEIYPKISNKEYQFTLSIEFIFNFLLEVNLDMYQEVLKKYLEKQNNPFSFNLSYLIMGLAKKQSIENSFNYIDSISVGEKAPLYFGVLMGVEDERLPKKYLQLVYKLFEDSIPRDIPNNLDFLLKFLHIEKKVVSNVVKILLEREANGEKLSWNYSRIFNSNTKVNEKLIELFKSDYASLKGAYFGSALHERSWDYDNRSLKKIIISFPQFLSEYVAFLIKNRELSLIKDKHNFTFIWSMDNWEEILSQVSSQIYESEKDNPYFSDSFLTRFFILNENEKEKDLKISRQDDFITTLIRDKIEDKEFINLIFNVVSLFSNERRIKHIQTFLSYNKDVKDFERIQKIRSSGISWGSLVPAHQNRVSFYEMLLPLLNSFEFFDHRRSIEETINSEREWIKREQRRDFLRDY